MKFLLDANMPRSAASLLRELGHQVEDVRDVLPPGADDSEVAAFAKSNQLVLITRDFDFADIRNYPRKIMRASSSSNCPMMPSLRR